VLKGEMKRCRICGRGDVYYDDEICSKCRYFVEHGIDDETVKTLRNVEETCNATIYVVKGTYIHLRRILCFATLKEFIEFIPLGARVVFDKRKRRLIYVDDVYLVECFLKGNGGVNCEREVDHEDKFC